MCQECAAAIKDFAAMMDQIRNQQRSMPMIVNERRYVQAETSIVLLPQSRNAERIMYVVAQCTSNATITIGDRIFNFTAAQSPFAPPIGNFILLPDDLRTMTQATKGFMSLELGGEELGDTGLW